MRNSKYHVYLTSEEKRLLLKALFNERNLLIANGRYTDAVTACDELNLDQLRSPKDLQKIAKAYEKCRRYADAEDILLQARERAPRSRSTLFHLCTVAVKAGDLESAHAYYNAFCNVAPDDKERYVLQYRIAM